MDEQQINEYRQPWESDEHWTLRKEFIERFWDDFPEDRLLCLAQVYSNVELLGCSYPAPVMRQIRELSKGLNECRELKEKRRERAAVQFVKEKQKAPPPRNSWSNSGSPSQKRPASESGMQDNYDMSNGTASKKLKTSDAKLLSGSCHAAVSQNSDRDLTTKQSSHLKKSQQKSTICVHVEQSSSKNITQESDTSSALSTSEPSSQMAIFPKCIRDNLSGILQFIRKSLTIQNTPVEILNNISSKFSLNYDLKYFSVSSGPVHECSVEIDNVFIAKAKEHSKKKARSEAAKLVVDMLMSLSPKVEKPTSSTPSELSIVSNTRIQTEQKCQGKTPIQNSCSVSKIHTSGDGVKPSGRTFDKIDDTGRKSGLLVNQSNHIHENAPWGSNLLPDPRIHPHSQNPRVVPNVYQNSGYEPDPWTNTNKGLNSWANNTRHQNHQQDLDYTNPCPQFLVVLDNSDITKMDSATSVFTHSANFNRVPFQFECETIVKGSQITTLAHITLNGRVLCSAEAEIKQAAKEAASKVALDILRKTAYTIKVNDEHEDGFTVTRSQVFNTAESNNSLTDSNIGCKMLKMMGWSGGGIGKTGKQGIEEPVKAVEKHKFGQGLGYTDKGNEEVSFTSRVEQIIQDYAKSKSTSDLIFSTEFSKEERKEIHRIACKYNLKNNSKGGKGDGRHIIISRRYTAQQLVDCLIRAGGRTHKYELMKPIG